MSEYKEMVYKSDMTAGECLASGESDGYKWRVVSYGTHPCAYVEVPRSHPAFGKTYGSLDIECHGGLTFSEMGTFGWDYAHFADRFGVGSIFDGYLKSWTTQEIVQHCLYVIEQFKEMEVKE